MNKKLFKKSYKQRFTHLKVLFSDFLRVINVEPFNSIKNYQQNHSIMQIILEY